MAPDQAREMIRLKKKNTNKANIFREEKSKNDVKESS